MSKSQRWPKLIAGVVASSCLLVGAVATAVTLGIGVVPDLGIMAWLVTAPVLGVLLVVRSGAPRMGWLLLLMALGGSLAAAGAAVPSSPQSLDWIWLIPVSTVGWFSWLALNLVGLPLLFPTGRPPTRRWQPLLWLLVSFLVVAWFLALFTPQLNALCSDADPMAADCATWESSGEAIAIGGCDQEDGVLECDVTLANPFGLDGVPHPETSLLGALTYGGLLVMAVLAVVSMGIRMRTAGSQVRQQLKFLFASLGFFILWTIVQAILVDGLGVAIPSVVENVMEFVSWTAIPVSIYLAITRYRLYDIDRLISRTLGYTVVVGMLAGGVALLATLAGTQFDSPVVVAATTLGVAAVFNPLRRRVQKVVDRRFNRSRYDAERVMDDFARSLRDEVNAELVVDGWVEVVSETMQPSSVGTWVRS